MRYQCTIGENLEFPLPDKVCEMLDIDIGDILICEKLEHPTRLSLRKYEIQSLTDEDIKNSNNLTRVFSFNGKIYE